MRPTRWPILVVLAVLAGAVGYVVTRADYDSLPTPKVYALLWLALLAIAELYLAVTTRARLAGRPGTRPVNPLVVARFVALAKASSIVGSLAAGGYAGFLIWVARLDSPGANRDTRTAAFGIAFGLVLAIAALGLERVCRVPKRDDDDDWPPPPPPDGR
jgi:uncharacterized membrane protein YbhN (UPF0104 family)